MQQLHHLMELGVESQLSCSIFLNSTSELTLTFYILAWLIMASENLCAELNLRIEMHIENSM